ncbi:hypothetical protein [Caulobacter sp. Root343]|uniref:head-tail joining protein n=1 Tax=Caulobacter sp. Root343 TaxID=1736520 RepID=UPI000713E67B|nr:hypothetical protein [Caulobacter sp. Root343]KQV66635.1 hypothetical protein ASC70_12440 [Caulobacter sp. Root343]
MDPDDMDDLVVDVAYETHGLRATYQPSSGDAVPDILLVMHQPPADQVRTAGFDLSQGLSVAENYLTMLVRSSQVEAPAEDETITFVGGRLGGKVFRIGEAPTDHDMQGREWRLKLQKLS